MIAQQIFYNMIPAFHKLSDITNQEHYYDVPADWYVALTDVRGSTKAIEAGRYKDVNAVAAASITAMLNQVPNVDLPFVFGGDGATILIPPNVVKTAGEALVATQRMAKAQFDLELRIGIVPVQDVLMGGYRIKVARLHMSDNFQQAVFMGGGLAYADVLLKDPEQSKKYTIPDNGEAYEADFSGFECRWNEIDSAYEETVSLIIKVVDPDDAKHNALYRDIIQKIEDIYGDSATRHPITVKNLKMTFNPKKLGVEAKVRHQDTSLNRIRRMMWVSFKARVAMALNLFKWGSYKEILIASTDHEKFDDTLRMIISGTAKQREALRAYLEEARQQGQLVYGTHTARAALMTCVVFDYFGRQVHFVDAADGGYALAAKELKAQLAG